MRPQSLDDYVGQESVVGPNSVLRQALEADRLPSLILWGPPGTGKTTLAMIVAQMTKSAFESLSATSAGVADLRKVVEIARQRGTFGRHTVLFIDEIHRFNKGQQDAILPHVEAGTVTLLGATTENPSFQVNSALLSRARVVRLNALSEDDLGTLVDRALGDADRGLANMSVGLEASGQGRAEVSVADVEGALQQPALLYDRAGDQHYWVISAFIKSVRGSDPDAAVYWLARMLEAGEDPLFVARRIVIAAAEDIGLADPQALSVAMAAHQAVHAIGMPEATLVLSQATLYLALAPKSNSAMRAYGAAKEDVLRTLHQPVPLHLRNAATGLDRAHGFGDHPESVGE